MVGNDEKAEKQLPKRKPNRLSGFDYSTSGAYFVTICTQNRRCILSKIVGDGFPVPKVPGEIAARMIEEIPKRFIGVSVEQFVIMPNHIHMILVMENMEELVKTTPVLGEVVAWYKYNTTRQINLKQGTVGQRVFQRSYHDHVIRNEKDHRKIWTYIECNPMLWAEDCFYSSEEDEGSGTGNPSPTKYR
ncbi:MAG: transposase [Clostridia bacterium]|nr:transposase [Clostridia bacterium]